MILRLREEIPNVLLQIRSGKSNLQVSHEFGDRAMTVDPVEDLSG
jgi:hypothetical protein